MCFGDLITVTLAASGEGVWGVRVALKSLYLQLF